MKEIKDVIQNNYRFNNIDLERNFDKEMEDDTFKKIVSKIKLSDRKSTRLNSSHNNQSRMPSSA